MHRGVVAGVTVLVAVALVGVVAGASPAGPAASASDSAPALSSPPAATAAPQTTPEGFDATVFEITVYENRSARWTLRYVQLLANDSEVETFEVFAEDFESGDPELARNFRTRAERLTAFGTNATGREMNATGFRRRAYTEVAPGGAQARGVVELSFRWANFARAVDRGVAVDDAFEGGMYVGPDQRLVFRPGPNLAFADADPPPDAVSGENVTDSRTITWFGEETYADQRPRVEFRPEDGDGAGGTDGDGAGTETRTATGDQPAGSGGLSTGLVLAVGLVLVLGAGGAAAWYTGALPGGSGPPGDGGAGAEPAVPAEGGGDASGDGTAQAGAGAGAAGPASPPEVSEEELLSDEDRVLALLEEHDGRMKQVNIVEETDWSKSKVSMLLSDMEDDGDISKLRVGRENIISLAGEEPDAAGSPFEEE